MIMFHFLQNFLFTLDLIILKVYVFFYVLMNLTPRLCLSKSPLKTSIQPVNFIFFNNTFQQPCDLYQSGLVLLFFFFHCYRAVIFGYLHHFPGVFFALLWVGAMFAGSHGFFIIYYFILVAHILQLLGKSAWQVNVLRLFMSIS